MFKEYVVKILYIVIFGGLLELIIPNNKLKQYIVSIISLLVIITMLSPVINVLKNETVDKTIKTAIETLSSDINSKQESEIKYDFSKYMNNIITESTKERLEQEIMENIQNDTNLNKIESVNVILNEEYVVKKIEIYVNKLNNIDKAKYISRIIEKISESYNIPKAVIAVIERG